MHDSYFMALNCFCWCYWPRWPGKGWPEEIPWQAVHAQPPLLPQWGWREFLGEGSKLRSHNLPCLLQSRSAFFPWWEKGTWALGRLFWESFAMELAIPCPWFPPAGCRIGLIATSQCVPQDWSDRGILWAVLWNLICFGFLFFFHCDTDLTLPALFLPTSSSNQLCLTLNSCLKSLNFPQPSVTDLSVLITDYSFQGLFHAVFSVRCETEGYDREGNQVSDNDRVGHKLNESANTQFSVTFNRPSLQGWIFLFQFPLGA